MLKANKKTLIIASIITVLPILIGIMLWSRLPDPMATHFGMDNEADGFSSKAFAVFGIPMFLLALEWIGAMVTSMDPRRQNITPKMFNLVLWIAPVVSIICAATIYSYNIGMKMNISFFGMLFTGLLLIVVGNYMPKARQNYTIGIRIPWTLANEQNWNKTHRMAGYLWVVGGILLILLGLIGTSRLEWFLAIIIVMVVVPAAYSCWLHTAKGL